MWDEFMNDWETACSDDCSLCVMPDGTPAQRLILAETCGGEAMFCPQCGRKLNEKQLYWKRCSSCIEWGMHNRVVCDGCVQNPFAPCGANKSDRYIKRST